MRYGEDLTQRQRAVAYYGAATVLTGFGVLSLTSIGFPFLLTGVLLFTLGPLRHRRDVLWPSLVGVWAFVVGYVLVGPLSCTSSGGGPAVPETTELALASSTSCTNLLGIDYAGGGSYNPPLLPALLAGLAVGGLSAFAARRLLRRRDIASA